MDYHLHWNVFLQRASAGVTYLDWIISGLEVTIAVGLTSWIIALILGSILGVLRSSNDRLLSGIAATYVEVFRNVPLLMQLFLWYFVAPELLPGGESFKQTGPVAQQFIASVICLSTYTAARICEQVRSGLSALPRGQRNAGLALGMNTAQTYRYVLLPVTFRIIVPPLTTEFVNVFQNSAIASTIGLLDLAAQGRQLVDYTARPYESFIVVTALYSVISVVVILLMRSIERRTQLPGAIGRK
jgi:glutamate/aspartate transport system permease protein